MAGFIAPHAGVFFALEVYANVNIVCIIFIFRITMFVYSWLYRSPRWRVLRARVKLIHYHRMYYICI